VILRCNDFDLMTFITALKPCLMLAGLMMTEIIRKFCRIITIKSHNNDVIPLKLSTTSQLISSIINCFLIRNQTFTGSLGLSGVDLLSSLIFP